MTYNIRLLNPSKDLPEVLQIDQLCNGATAWTETEYLTELRQRNVVGVVLVDGHKNVLAYMLYELHKARIAILQAAVHPDVQGQGLGTFLFTHLIEKLSPDRRHSITLMVRERALAAQKFLHKLGFKAIRVMRDTFLDTGEDGYLFVYSLEVPAEHEVTL